MSPSARRRGALARTIAAEAGPIIREPELRVTCPSCGDDYKNDRVKTSNIEEDISGRDVVTFYCPFCEKEVQSFVFSK